MPDPDLTPEALKQLVTRLQSPLLPTFDDCREAAAAISALMAERDALVKALLPFAEVADWAERNGCDLLNDVDYIQRDIRPGQGKFGGHAGVQGRNFIAARKALGAVITCEECDGEGCLTCNGTGISTIARSTSQGGEG